MGLLKRIISPYDTFSFRSAAQPYAGLHLGADLAICASLSVSAPKACPPIRRLPISPTLTDVGINVPELRYVSRQNPMGSDRRGIDNRCSKRLVCKGFD